jgi:hypothetical protein
MAALFIAAITAVDTTINPELNAKLSTSSSQLDRLALLPSNKDWLFDFSTQKSTYSFSPGGVTNMNAATFPAAKGHGLTRTFFLSLPLSLPASDPPLLLPPY